jgi:hypothetical protein
MLLELEKFRKISLADGRIMMTEMTKKQRLILEVLNLMCLTSSGAYGVTSNGSFQVIQQTTRIGRKRQGKKRVVSDEPVFFLDVRGYRSGMSITYIESRSHPKVFLCFL